MRGLMAAIIAALLFFPSDGSAQFARGNMGLPTGFSQSAPAAAGNSYVGPCDVLATNSAPCGSAYSSTRAMLSAYIGQPLYQLIRTSDSTTLNVSTHSSGASAGIVDTSATPAFCGVNNANGCQYNLIYDHNTSCANNLAAGDATHRVNYEQYQYAGAAAYPYINSYLANTPVTAYYLYQKRPGTGNFLPCTTGGNHSMMVYAVFDWPYHTSASYGNGVTGFESPIFERAEGAQGVVSGHPVILGTAPAKETFSYGGAPCAFTFCLGIDTEDVWLPTTSPLPGTPNIVNSITSYCTGTGNFRLDAGNAQSGSLSNLLNVAAWGTPNWEGGIIIGGGGDGTDSGYSFFEGAFTETCPSSTANNALQANIVAFYGAQPSNTYAGPCDLATCAHGWGASTAASSTYANGYNTGATLVRASDLNQRSIVYLNTGILDTATADEWCHGTTCYYIGLPDNIGSNNAFANGVSSGDGIYVTSNINATYNSGFTYTDNCFGTLPCGSTIILNAQSMVTFSAVNIATPLTYAAVGEQTISGGGAADLMSGYSTGPEIGFDGVSTSFIYAGTLLTKSATDSVPHFVYGCFNGGSSVQRTDLSESTGVNPGSTAQTGVLGLGQNGVGGGGGFITGDWAQAVVITSVTVCPTATVSGNLYTNAKAAYTGMP